MFKNHLKIAWRSILKNRGISSINIIGLSFGIASCLLIALFVIDEISYDKFNENADRIVRIVFRAEIGDEVIKEGGVMAPVAQTLIQDFPEVLDATRIRDLGAQKISVEHNTYRENRFAFVDANFFDVFTLPIIEGNSKSPLEKPDTAVITKAEALKFFGSTNAIGRIFYVEGHEEPITVTGIIEEVPKNSHFHFDIFLSMNGFEEAKSDSWFRGDFFTYLLLQEGSNYKGLQAKLPQVIEKYMGPGMQEEMGVPFEEFTKDNELGFALQPLTDIHLHSDNSSYSELEQGGDIKYVYIFSVVALFMLLIACTNFVNLATAAASKRAKEVGIRKVMGSNKNQLLYQFLAESFIATLLAMLLAVILVVLFLPVYNELSGKELQFTYLLQPSFLSSLLLLTFIISLLAGGYPAFFLSSFKPISALKTKFLGSGDNKNIRNGLVVFQFVISSGLILSTLIVNQQMDYIQNKNLGYEKDQILVIRDSYLLGSNQTAFKNELLKNPKVANLTQSAFVPAGPSDKNQALIYLNGEVNRRMPEYNIDENYLSTMGMKLVAGRNFSKEFGADSTNVIINQTYAKIFGFGNDAVGRTINDGHNKLTVIGVVKDFHFNTFHQSIEPLLIRYRTYGGLIVRSKTSDMAGLIADTQRLWNSFNSKETFGYTLLNESYDQTYITEQKMGTVLNIFALLTVLVACLGLFGLVTFSTEQRFKEIGIRKVLGSTVSQIVAMLSKDFLKLIGISFLLAFPLGYYFMGKWLNSFAYKTTISWQVFLSAGAFTLIIALLTVSWHSYKAAVANPIKSLRTE
ncbi:ABC transporter permease [Flagellimonas myxillae]|uniref:ABC transporter permease n=1 Tax=Flagellimonas myxillae TaxID=2942214 RepID=UPI00201ECD65|nr:ABC transporter permease [Muricauda myxillae]MCL6266541.1 ABC transporter permease [Muricauda myxillae]